MIIVEIDQCTYVYKIRQSRVDKSCRSFYSSNRSSRYQVEADAPCLVAASSLTGLVDGGWYYYKYSSESSRTKVRLRSLAEW